MMHNLLKTKAMNASMVSLVEYFISNWKDD